MMNSWDAVAFRLERVEIGVGQGAQLEEQRAGRRRDRRQRALSSWMLVIERRRYLVGWMGRRPRTSATMANARA
jgi:hypothetical protein